MLVDTHCHLSFQAFDADRQAVLARARQAGLGRILNPGVDLESSRQGVELAHQISEVYAAVGVHPNDSATWDPHNLDYLRELAGHPKVVAIGEIGVDYYRDRSPRDAQRRILESQLQLALQAGLPVIIHLRNASQADRRAGADLLEILKDWQVEVKKKNKRLFGCPGVLHSFSEDSAYASKVLELKFLVGISGPVTFHKAVELQEVVKVVPLASILIETDAPFLSPHPLRGRRNEPGNAMFIVERVAQLRGITQEEVIKTTTANAERLFHWQAIHS